MNKGGLHDQRCPVKPTSGDRTLGVVEQLSSHATMIGVTDCDGLHDLISWRRNHIAKIVVNDVDTGRVVCTATRHTRKDAQS